MSTPNRIPKNQIRILIAILLTGFLSQRAIAQFAPAAGQPGSTALRADSSCFINWASKCHVQRGLKQINLPDSGYASVGSAQSAIGQASTNGVASLGDGGIATLTFDPPISDGNGFDFAIFENTFLDSFLELAFVEVSTDSQSWARFPNESLSQHKTQTGSFGFTQPTKIHNLAGKYRHPYGTPFDLQDVAMMSNIRINEIRYVRIIDVVGSIDTLYAQRDSKNRIINDPWPTPFPSSGFDLDAVGVIHQAEFNNINTSLTQNTIPFYFHSESRTIHLRSNSTKNPANSRIENNLKIFNAAGQLCFLAEFKPDQTNNYQIEIPKFLSAGTYIARYNNYSIKIILTDNR
jgi:hypothetical protein